MGLNLSNHQIAKELDLNKDDVQQMTSQLRSGIALNKPEVQLSGAVECDEVYVIAGHKGKPEVVKKKVGRDVFVGWKPSQEEEHSPRRNRQFSAWFSDKEKL